MKVSASFELIWQIAAHEAVAGRFSAIAPDHFCMALLKFAELPVAEIDRAAKGAQVAKDLAQEVDAVKMEIEGRGVESARARRELRAAVGKGNAEHDGGRLHRTQEARALFDDASRLADDEGSEIVLARHLLEAILAHPTEAMNGTLGECLARKSTSPFAVMDEAVKDLADAAAEVDSEGLQRWNCQATAILHLLSEKEAKCILLITDSEQDVRATMTALARLSTDKARTRGQRINRILDATALDPMRSDDPHICERIVKVLGVAGQESNTVLYLASLMASSTEESGAWRDVLRQAALMKGVRYVCGMTPRAYSRVAKDSAWRRVSQAVWLHERPSEGIPNEL